MQLSSSQIAAGGSTAITVSDERSPVSVIGLGAMGAALAGAFVDRGQPTTVWNRSAEKGDDLVAKGATRAATVADAVAASPLVVVCVLDYLAVREILDPVSHALSGRVLVNLTNGTPQQARQMAHWAAERGAEYLDGGIMAIPPMIGQPEAVLLYSGSRAAFDIHERELGRIGTSRYLGADPGLASLHDLALLSAMYGMFAGALHGLALVGTEKVKATEFMAMVVPWVTAMTAALPGLAQQVEAGDYTTDVTANLGMQAVGFADGHGADDLAGLIELIRKPAPA